MRTYVSELSRLGGNIKGHLHEHHKYKYEHVNENKENES